jgi:hypothetical protein
VVEALRDGAPIDVESMIEVERARYGDRPEKKPEKPAVVGKKS